MKSAGTYVPPTCEQGSPIDPRNQPQLAPGVRGFAVEVNGKVYIPDIVAENKGAGDVGRFLDSLSPKCVIANVVSMRLEGMLERRGWIPTVEDVPPEQGGGCCDVWLHPSKGSTGGHK